jgi:two-component sensor histidine kinase
LSDTTYLHEVTQPGAPVRVSLQMDSEEARALADVAAAALDAAVMLSHVGEAVEKNAAAINKWAHRVANTLETIQKASSAQD